MLDADDDVRLHPQILDPPDDLLHFVGTGLFFHDDNHCNRSKGWVPGAKRSMPQRRRNWGMLRFAPATHACCVAAGARSYRSPDGLKKGPGSRQARISGRLSFPLFWHLRGRFASRHESSSEPPGLSRRF